MPIKKIINKIKVFFLEFKYGTEKKPKIKIINGVECKCYISKNGELTTEEETKSMEFGVISSDNNKKVSVDGVTKKVYKRFETNSNEIKNIEVTNLIRKNDKLHNIEKIIYTSKENLENKKPLTRIKNLYIDENNTDVTIENYACEDGKHYLANIEKIEKRQNFDGRKIHGFSCDEKVYMEKTQNTHYYSNGCEKKVDTSTVVYENANSTNKEKTYKSTTSIVHEGNKTTNYISQYVNWNGIQGLYERVDGKIQTAINCYALNMEPKGDGKLRIQPNLTVDEMISMSPVEKVQMKHGTVKVEITGKDNDGKYFENNGGLCRITTCGSKNKEDALRNSVMETLGKGDILQNTHVKYVPTDLNNIGLKNINTKERDIENLFAFK